MRLFSCKVSIASTARRAVGLRIDIFSFLQSLQHGSCDRNNDSISFRFFIAFVGFMILLLTNSNGYTVVVPKRNQIIESFDIFISFYFTCNLHVSLFV